MINVTTANAGGLVDSLNLIVTCRILYLYDGELMDKNIRFSEFEFYLKPRGYYISSVEIYSFTEFMDLEDFDLTLLGEAAA